MLAMAASVMLLGKGSNVPVCVRKMRREFDGDEDG